MIDVNPHALLLAGENSFLRLSDDGSPTPRHWVSHWRVVWSPVGSGHAVMVDSPLVFGVRILSDNTELAVLLTRLVESILYPKFATPAISVMPAKFDKSGVPPLPVTESVAAEGLHLELRWSDFMEPFSFSAGPGFRGGPLALQTTLFPARTAELLVNGERAEGAPWIESRGNQACTSACLAWCETWYRPRDVA